MLGVPEEKFAAMSDAVRDVPFIRVVSMGKVHPVSLSDEKKPDMFFGTTDSAWAENISLLGYNFESGLFSIPGLDSNKWLQDYITIGSKEQRMGVLRKLHYDVLQNATIVPLEVTPFFSLIKAGWKLNQSKIMIGTELWALRRN